jgi:hypothetical protein
MQSFYSLNTRQTNPASCIASYGTISKKSKSKSLQHKKADAGSKAVVSLAAVIHLLETTEYA